MKHELFKPDAALLDALLAEPSESRLRVFFQSRVARIAQPFIHDECFTFGLFDDLIDALSPSGAFDLLPCALSLARTETSLDRFTCALSLVSSLAHRSNTTEQPASLAHLYPELSARVAALGHCRYAASELTSIRDWYRLQ